MPLAPWYRAACDTLLRHEHLQDDFTSFVTAVLPQHANDTALPWVSSASPARRNLSYELSRADVARIGKAYALDLETFNYTLEEIPCPIRRGV